MNKYFLPTILFAGLLLAGCSNPDSKPVVTVEDVHLEEVKQEPPPPPPPSKVDSSAKKKPNKK